MLGIIYLWLAVVNVWGFLLVFLDKRRAKKGDWRIPEAVFFLLAFLGGFLGIEFAMRLFHHKTKKPSFYWVIRCAFLVWLVLGIILIYIMFS